MGLGLGWGWVGLGLGVGVGLGLRSGDVNGRGLRPRPGERRQSVTQAKLLASLRGPLPS